MSISQLVAVLGTFVVAASASVGASLALQVATKKFTKAAGLETRIAVLTRSLASAAELISEIEREVEKRSELATKLQQDVSRYSRLKEIDAPKVEAVAQALRIEIQNESKRSLWVTFAQNVVFFILGAAFAYWLARR
jgi:hypothetical protein